MKNILVRYGELTLKGNNKNIFINKLIQNIKFKLKPYKDILEYKKDHNSLTIKVNDDSFLETICESLTKVFGIYSISVAEIVERDVNKVLEYTLKVAQSFNKGTFKVEVDRKDKFFELGSTEMKLKIAANILKNCAGLKVDVHNPDLKITVIIKQDGIYIFTSRQNGIKGLPVGIGGKAISLLSGGIDSPVASYLVMKRGMVVDFLHFMTPPHTSVKALEKVFTLAKKLQTFNHSSFMLYVCDFSMILRELMHIKDESYRITIMRRVFVRIANKLATQIKAKAIITGDNLGQVASQTIESINTINETSNLTILRPLLTFDKEEIIHLAKQIGTYETSILPFDDVCSMYVPNKPVTKPKAYIAREQEKDILLDELIEYTISKFIKYYYFKDGEMIEKVEQNQRKEN